jgi:hypothetical protein
VRSTAAPYTESRLTRSVANERVGFPVVEHFVCLLVKVFRTAHLSSFRSVSVNIRIQEPYFIF